MTIKGSCHCGKSRYVIDLEELTDVATCHCTACRKSTGGTHVTWATVPQPLFHWASGAPASYQSSEHCTRYFCRTCGAQLAFHSNRTPGTIDITVTTLENPDRFPPTRHIWTQSKLGWVHLDDDLRREDEESI